MEQQLVPLDRGQPPLPRSIEEQRWSDEDRATWMADAPVGQAAVEDAMGRVVELSLMRARYGRGMGPGLPELDKAFVNPAAVFDAPDDVVRHPLLTLDSKREILWRWAWDEYLLDLANAEGMAEGEPSRLPEVKAALRLVNQEWSPDPAAPAAFIVHYRRDLQALAA